jgi:hypothetical protein
MPLSFVVVRQKMCDSLLEGAVVVCFARGVSFSAANSEAHTPVFSELLFCPEISAKHCGVFSRCSTKAVRHALAGSYVIPFPDIGRRASSGQCSNVSVRRSFRERQREQQTSGMFWRGSRVQSHIRRRSCWSSDPDARPNHYICIGTSPLSTHDCGTVLLRLLWWLPTAT